MNETEIRDRVRGALGEPGYPPALEQRIASRLARPVRRRESPVLGVVAGILAIVIVGTLIFVRLQSPARPLPAVTPAASPSPQPVTPMAAVGIPQADLDRADLSESGDLVTPLNLTSTSSGRTVTLIGAYADGSRTVLFLRTMPEAVLHPMIYDDSGFLNAGAGGGRGIVGDWVYSLEAGPHAAGDGMAHLKVVINGIDSMLGSAHQSEKGNWTFVFALRLPPSIHLLPAPPLTSFGSWKFTVDAFEVTSSEVHFQAEIDGAPVADINRNTFSMVGTRGKPLELVTYAADATATNSTRVDLVWSRPAISDVYFLVVKGKYQGGVEIPGSVDSTPAKKGHPLAPTDYPAANEAITFDGVLSTTVTTAHPNECGHGEGPSGAVFAFGMWFQVDQAWYTAIFSTDPRVRQYSGPGTYDIRAQIWPLGSNAIFDGTVRLTVKNDRLPWPETGSVNGTLTWTGAATQPYRVNVAGDWSCVPGGQLGPG